MEKVEKVEKVEKGKVEGGGSGWTGLGDRCGPGKFFNGMRFSQSFMFVFCGNVVL